MRSLHIAGASNPIDGERVEASVGKLLGSVQIGDAAGKGGARNLEWKAEVRVLRVGLIGYPREGEGTNADAPLSIHQG